MGVLVPSPAWAERPFGGDGQHEEHLAMPKLLQHEDNDPFPKKQHLPQSSIALGCPVPSRRLGKAQSRGWEGKP